QSGLQDELELHVDQCPHRPRPSDRQAHAQDERDGARDHARPEREGERRHLHRYEGWERASHRRARGRRRGERLRDIAPPAQLQVGVVPERPGERQWHGREIPHGHDRHRCGRVCSQDDGSVMHNHDGVGGMHVYMPWWLDNKKLDFPRGYHIEVWGGLRAPGAGFMGGIHRYPPGGGYGKQLKQDYRKYYGATIGFSGRGEQIPNADCYCEIDPNVVDRFGIPVLRFHWKWTDHEFNQVKHMHETFRALITQMG